MRNYIFRRSVLIILLAVSVSGCNIIRVQSNRQSAQSVPAGGIFRTETKGDSWAQKNDVYAVGTPKKLQYTTVTFLKFDPQDSRALYLGTNNGIYYSYNNGDGWFQSVPGNGVVNDLAIDPKSKCTLYAAVHNKVYKSTDCARSWELIHFSSLANQFFTAIQVSDADSSLVYLGTSNGTLLLSRNAGVSWEVIRFFDSPITKFVGHSNEPGTFYVVTPKFGVQVSRDEGVTFTDLNELPVRNADGTDMPGRGNNPKLLKELSQTNIFYDLKFDESQQNGLIYANGYGIFRLVNEEYWQEIEILNKPRQTKIFAIALDGVDGNSLYFATTGAFYRSDNGGKDWTVKQLPASGTPKNLVITPDKRDELFISIVAPPPK